MQIGRNDRGFNLTEVLVAMVILSIGMVAVASLIIGIIRGNQVSRDVSIATTLAQDKIEAIIQQGYGGISTADATETEDYNSIADYSRFKRVTVIKVGTPSDRMKTVTVSVYWATGTQPVVLDTILAR